MIEAMPIILFFVLFALLMFGYPVAFTLGGVSILMGAATFGFDFFNLLPLRVWGVMTNYVLIAVPLFLTKYSRCLGRREGCDSMAAPRFGWLEALLAGVLGLHTDRADLGF